MEFSELPGAMRDNLVIFRNIPDLFQYLFSPGFISIENRIEVRGYFPPDSKAFPFCLVLKVCSRCVVII